MVVAEEAVERAIGYRQSQVMRHQNAETNKDSIADKEKERTEEMPPSTATAATTATTEFGDARPTKRQHLRSLAPGDV